MWVPPPLTLGTARTAPCFRSSAAPESGSRVPAYQRRAPLRRPRRGAVECSHVFPPINGGLHCGACLVGKHVAVVCSRLSTAGSIAAGHFPVESAPAGVPAYQRRAPLRRPHAAGSRERAPCSRLSTAGSIAASRPADPARRSRCSRLSTAGSIAAIGASALHSRGVPAYQRRAPLRRVSPGGVGNAPGVPAYQRRAPLRR